MIHSAAYALVEISTLLTVLVFLGVVINAFLVTLIRRTAILACFIVTAHIVTTLVCAEFYAKSGLRAVSIVLTCGLTYGLTVLKNIQGTVAIGTGDHLIYVSVQLRFLK